MFYSEAIEYLFASKPAFHLIGSAAYKPGLENTYALMTHLGQPQTRFLSVHVAGTNGKGSVSHLIAAALQAAGLKTGLYTSPHLIDFRERIRINGEMIPEDNVVRFVDQNKDLLDQVQPSFFETTMAMAFDYFAQEKVNIAVIEVGLGGRLDSTNIITPLLSVITNIGWDHTEFLGHTLAAIASEKAGIIKPGVPCVVGETDDETAPVFIRKARECGLLDEHVPLFWFADQCTYLSRFRQKHIPFCQLQGLYQDRNQQTAFVALRYLQSLFPTLTTHAIAEGYQHVCQSTGLRGRWEILSDKPLTICDTGHNSHGLKYVFTQLRSLLEQRRKTSPHASLHIVFGMVDDKDVDTVFSLMPDDAVYYFTQASTHRAIPAQQFAERFESVHASCPFQPTAYQSVGEAVQAAQQAAQQADILFIGGSNYVVGEALRMS